MREDMAGKTTTKTTEVTLLRSENASKDPPRIVSNAPEISIINGYLLELLRLP